jgi:hypothetical protein
MGNGMSPDCSLFGCSGGGLEALTGRAGPTITSCDRSVLLSWSLAIDPLAVHLPSPCHASLSSILCLSEWVFVSHLNGYSKRSRSATLATPSTISASAHGIILRLERTPLVHRVLQASTQTYWIRPSTVQVHNALPAIYYNEHA